MVKKYLSALVTGIGTAGLLVGTAYAFTGTWTSQWTSEELPPAMCADDTVATKVECNGSRCDNIRVTCTNAPRDLQGHSWTAYKSEEAGYNYCPAGSYATGIDCRGAYCDDEAIQCTRLTSAVQSNCQWVGPFSEEAPVNFGQCPANKFIAGLYCSGGNCDNQHIYCCNM
ncbi:MAG TPA: hypothetical protein VMF89_09110 [Polyangiales bacterium]|nr:hypothetical protein [Polyangiales bacterium]